MKRRPGQGPSPSWPWAFMTKWRRDHLLLLALIGAAMFCAARMSHLRQSSRDASTIRTVLTTTQGVARETHFSYVAGPRSNCSNGVCTHVPQL